MPGCSFCRAGRHTVDKMSTVRNMRHIFACGCHAVRSSLTLLNSFASGQVEEVDADYDPDFLRHMYPRLEWPALKEAAHAMGEHLQDIPTPLKIQPTSFDHLQHMIPAVSVSAQSHPAWGLMPLSRAVGPAKPCCAMAESIVRKSVVFSFGVLCVPSLTLSPVAACRRVKSASGGDRGHAAER